MSYHRRSLRLRGWNYAWAAWYFVTIVSKHRAADFGSVRDGRMILSKLGQAAQACWLEIPDHHEGVGLDAFVVMPDHVHGIVILGNGDLCGPVQLNRPTANQNLRRPTAIPNPRAHIIPSPHPTQPPNSMQDIMSAISPAKGTLSVIIRTYKAAVTTWARRNGHPEFAWQSLFYDHVIRSKSDIERIRNYIQLNPAKWNLDRDPQILGSKLKCP